MRVLVLAKEDHQSEAAKPPTPETRAEFQKFNEELVKAAVVLGDGRGTRTGRPRCRARAVAHLGRAGEAGRLADGYREASRDRSDPPPPDARTQARRDRTRH